MAVYKNDDEYASKGVGTAGLTLGIISRVRPWLEMAGILDEKGIDTDALKAALDEGFAKVPNLSYFGFTFTSADIAPLLGKMTGQEVV